MLDYCSAFIHLDDAQYSETAYFLVRNRVKRAKRRERKATSNRGWCSGQAVVRPHSGGSDKHAAELETPATKNFCDKGEMIMNIDMFYRIFARSLFFLALAMLALGFLEIAANLLGFTVLRGAYSSGRLVELSAALLVFVIVVLLRQIRDALTNRGSI